MSAIIVYDNSHLTCYIELSVKLVKKTSSGEELKQEMIVQLPEEVVKGNTLGDVGLFLQRQVYEQLREGYARLLDQVAEAEAKA